MNEDDEARITEPSSSVGNVEGKSREDEANIFSHLFFYWAQPLFRRASDLHKENKALELNDLLPLPKIDESSTIFHWNDTSTNEKVSQTMMKVMGRRFVLAGMIKVVNTGLQFTFPLLLRAILQFMEDTQAGRISSSLGDSWYDVYKGYWLSALLFAAMASKAVTENHYFHMVYRCGYHVKVALSVSVYQKSLRLASYERQAQTLGELLNLMQVDASKIEMFVPQIHVLWDGLVQICGYMVILYTLIGWSCLTGFAIMVLAGPMQGLIMMKLFQLNRDLVQHTDARVKSTNEAVQGIRCVKMYTWEDSFASAIDGSRALELTMLKKAAYLRGASRAYMGALPAIVAVVSFVVYALVTDTDIKASTLFAALVAFGQLRFPLLFYPMSLAQYAQAKVSMQRMQKFLHLSEIKSQPTDKHSTNEEKGTVIVENATIYWRDPNDLSKPIETKDDTDNKNKQKDSASKSPKIVEENDNDDNEVAESNLPNTAVLTDVNWKVQPGELCAIVGRVGSGKSTLCSAILNETVLKKGGSIHKRGTIAYASQSPWILNATIRENITFGLPYEETKYNTIIDACQLNHDLSLLEFGDLTEIGENGINLSGGQKQRVSMARATYSDADIYILDDPLSALDPEVGKELFDECIAKYLKKKTRIFVTNQLQYLKFCDSIVALGNNQIIEQGTFQDLVLSNKNDGNGQVQKLLEDLKQSRSTNASANTNGDVSSDIITNENDTKDVSLQKPKSAVPNHENESTKVVEKKENTGLVTKEERNVGAVSWQTYKQYIKAGGGYLRFLFAYSIYILCSVVDLFNTGWVAIWTGDAKYERQSRSYYLGIYALLAVILGLVTFFRSFLLAIFGVRASGNLHRGLLRSVLHAPMSFFDTTPTGRILSRFSKDLYSIDMELSEMLDFFLFCGLTVVFALGTMTVVTPYFGIAIIPLAYVYVKALNYFREVSRETKRLESISRSPVFAHFSETLGGLGTIRAYEQTDRFIDEFEKRVDSNTRAYYNNKTADRWLSVRLELIGAIIGGLAAFFACNVVIANKSASGTSSASDFASAAGLSLTYAISLTGLLNWVVRSFAQMEAAMNAAERIFYYTDNIPQEAPFTTKQLEKYTSKTETGKDRTSLSITDESHVVNPAVVAVKSKGIDSLPSGWPTSGSITLTDLNMKYRPENPLVIKGLTLNIVGGERVGVVGRTGSGKSSLLLTLLRIVEPTLISDSYNDPPISIDGVDILRIGVSHLRSQIGIIPQNPVLFSGTIRSNLDPFDKYTDDEIWNALERCGMKDAVIDSNKKNANSQETVGDDKTGEDNYMLLSAPVAEYGENWSQGQRQLLCLGRALLRKCRILLLDEATSSVDYETDANIQRTLREDCIGCTVLTIAHRVNTIMDSDKILVMKDGKVAEYAPPQDLLNDSTSLFYDIVQHSQSEHSHSLEDVK